MICWCPRQQTAKTRTCCVIYTFKSASDFDCTQWREKQPKARNDHWDGQLVVWSRIEYGAQIQFKYDLFGKQYERCQYVRHRKKKQLSQYKSCCFDVVFVTKEHAQMVRSREAAIREQNKQIRDATIAELEFPIEGINKTSRFC